MEKYSQVTQSLLADSTSDPIFQLFSKVGTMGRYQKISLIFWSLSCYICGGLTLITPFLFYQDPYVCDQTISNCFDYVCSKQPSQRQPFIPQKSMLTLANQFGDYRCSTQSSTLDAAVMLMYSSTVFSYLILAIFGDYLGRKKFMIGGLALTIAGLVFALVSVNLIMAAFGLLISCLGIQWAYSISFMFISQTVAQSYRQQFLVISQLFYGIGHIANTGFYYWLEDWKLVFIYFYIVPSVLLMIGFTYFTVDTPICLIRKLSPKMVCEKLREIAKINGIEEPQITEKEIQTLKIVEKTRQKQEQSGSKFTVFDLFKYPSLRTLTICVAILQNSILFLFYSPTLMLAQFQLNIFVNGLVIGASSLLSYPFCYFMITRTKRKTMALASFIVIFICSFVLIFFWHPRNDQVELPLSQNIGILVAFFVISFVVTTEYIFYQVYLIQLYPTQVRLIGGSFATVMGGITISFSDFIIDGCNNGGFSLMILFSLFSIISILASIKLPETYDKVTPDFIEELSQRISGISCENKENQINAEKAEESVRADQVRGHQANEALN